MSDSTTVSVKSCRNNRPRPAPSAARSDSSDLRDSARASCRFATFAQATSSTRTTAASSVSSAGRSGPAICSRSDSTVTPISAFSAGYSRESPAAMADSSRCASPTATPGRRRPTAQTLRWPRRKFVAPEGIAVTGSHTSIMAPNGDCWPGPSTPITTQGRPFSVRVRPTMLGSAPSRPRHMPSDSTATAASVPGRVSSGVNTLPRAAVSPSTPNISAVTNSPPTRSGVSPPVRLTLWPRTTPMSTKERLRARKSCTSV